VAYSVSVERSYPVGEQVTSDNPPTTIRVEADTVEEATTALNNFEINLGYKPQPSL
jgi:hypothetical protein